MNKELRLRTAIRNSWSRRKLHTDDECILNGIAVSRFVLRRSSGYHELNDSRAWVCDKDASGRDTHLNSFVMVSENLEA